MAARQPKSKTEEPKARMTRDDATRDPHADTTMLAPDRAAKDVKAEAAAQVDGGQDLSGTESMVEPDHQYATDRDRQRGIRAMKHDS